ncbi:nickel-responsive transcriptional regulator NikR [Rhodovulum sp. BSW8]|uniref:Putative nickel-responsive regulator n=1 Tax=Rhodovulum visakhapatnamense TaxID=364297 RepID=A0A4R8FTZ8_9RHOB|nr:MULTISPECIES: nickel-responsive transcriptional regulator NikR [Rhodovulum]OLS46686.1 nickel responsive regulator [Rhodovulum sulfidophilum]MBL3570909.1 nickel-responsive transcriptional regulator NikR [Rhodovulum visakhapatnamense]MBL3578202.1 nickel-responsive transcriptional regulator NikR [Rhodovulum visakhapatnamense]RBO54508.1 nickel-responsive transcriptional regulator NikR [Rhodovulum sp. BSW8]TDX30176.1 CopG family nickel-responsive transcriptional regulator [Rhodovulum visakhapatn
MQRITITIEDDLLEALDAFMDRSGASNRSEALRDLIRRGLDQDAPEAAECVGVVTYAMDPAQRDLGRLVPESRQQHHDAAIAALSVPLDHHAAVEVAVMRGTVGSVQAYANSLFLQRGVRHGQTVLIPVRTEVEFHLHGERAHTHDHLRVLDRF